MTDVKVKRAFEKGEFITNTNKPGSFAIFEGVECESQSTYYKKFSVITYYDPSKYRELEHGGWGTKPYLEVATRTTRCEQTVDGDTTSYWWRPCSASEREKAIDLLQQYGYYWNDELKAIVSKETGEIVRTIVEPKLEYNGDVVKPISQKFKDLLRKVCDEIIDRKYAYKSQVSYYGDYDGFWGEEWD